ncbi:Gustatory receptor for sugar taste 43a [Eumeta japonica]|uniref:Gustatory receptor n=1 Tax=Eumeta variegata TaxID=151549 RepID=A0A4C1WVE9_EUMVA|nr:Gustatory receptor for sugar taste 43a [Eumeta japonica]
MESGEARAQHAAGGATAQTRPAEASPCVVGGAHAFILRGVMLGPLHVSVQISSAFGLAPLKFEPRSTGFAVSISSAMCVYSYVLITILVIFTILGLAAEIRVGMELSVRMTSRMSQVVSTCDVMVVVVTAGAGVYGAPYRMRKMLKFMDTMVNQVRKLSPSKASAAFDRHHGGRRMKFVDTSLGTEYSAASERRLCALLLSILLFFSILIGDDFCFYANQARKYSRQWEVVLNYVGFYLLWYIAVILELQFAFTALSVRTRFRAVNDALAHTAKHISVPVEKIPERGPLNMLAVRVALAPARGVHLLLNLPSAPPAAAAIILRKSMGGTSRLTVAPCEAVRRLAVLHGSLCDVVNQLGASYGLPLLVILLSTLLHLIVTPYFLIVELMVSTQRLHFLVLQFLWCATHLLRVFVIVEPCHYTVDEGKRTEELVCRLMTYAPPGGVLPVRLELFSRQLLMRSVHYSPLGMCVLDRPLVASEINKTRMVLDLVFDLIHNSFPNNFGKQFADNAEEIYGGNFRETVVKFPFVVGYNGNLKDYWTFSPTRDQCESGAAKSRRHQSDHSVRDRLLNVFL